MKAIFLDIDGVISTLNSRAANYLQNKGPDEMVYDGASLAFLGRLVERTGAIVVLSSSWRADIDSGSAFLDTIVSNLFAQLASAGAPISDMTPMIAGADRSAEIGAWLDAHPCEAYAILDDHARFEMRPEVAEGHLVLIEDSNGIRTRHFMQALDMLR